MLSSPNSPPTPTRDQSPKKEVNILYFDKKELEDHNDNYGSFNIEVCIFLTYN